MVCDRKSICLSWALENEKKKQRRMKGTHLENFPRRKEGLEGAIAKETGEKRTKRGKKWG